MKIASLVLLAASLAVTSAYAGSTFSCDYQWDITHEAGIIIQKGQPILSDGVPTGKYEAEVAFFHATRVAAPQPISYESEILAISHMETRLGTETSYSIDFGDGTKLYFSNRNFDGDESSAPAFVGTYTGSDGKDVGISCSLGG